MVNETNVLTLFCSSLRQMCYFLPQTCENWADLPSKAGSVLATQADAETRQGGVKRTRGRRAKVDRAPRQLLRQAAQPHMKHLLS